MQKYLATPKYTKLLDLEWLDSNTLQIYGKSSI